MISWRLDIGWVTLSIRHKKQLFNPHRFPSQFGRLCWRLANSAVLANEIEMPDKQSDSMAQVFNLL
jgi:hypothetical protein